MGAAYPNKNRVARFFKHVDGNVAFILANMDTDYPKKNRVAKFFKHLDGNFVFYAG
jgi:hypothetical protein